MLFLTFVYFFIFFKSHLSPLELTQRQVAKKTLKWLPALLCLWALFFLFPLFEIFPSVSLLSNSFSFSRLSFSVPSPRCPLTPPVRCSHFLIFPPGLFSLTQEPCLFILKKSSVTPSIASSTKGN